MILENIENVFFLVEYKLLFLYLQIAIIILAFTINGGKNMK